MIPILFDKNETTFNSNGLCRLRDCISATVVEERNSIYELNFDYPVDGANYDLIECGRIVGVTHEDSDDIQPFEIVSVTRPINGIVSFHAVHISYRQSQMVVMGTNINSLADAFTMVSAAVPSNPFRYETDMSSTGYMAAADGTPRSVRQLLGGVSGSILDAYGGEYEWDKWTVRLLSARGEVKDFAIRYGVNLLDYNDETDCRGSFTSCVAYWNGEEGVVTATASTDRVGYNGNDIRVPLDLTDRFETQPSAAQLEAEAMAYMRSNQTYVPSRSIRVDFARLSEVGEFDQFENLLTCKLCDSLTVIFPAYNVSASFKIVKTEWNVLEGRYESMELGKLSTTLSEALGIGSTSSTSAGGGGGAENLDIYVQATGSSNSKTTFNASTLTQIPMEVKSFESGNLFSIDNGGIKVSEAGIYKVSASAYLYTISSTTARGIYIMTGSTFASATEVTSFYELKPTGEEYASISVSPKLISLNAGDTIYLGARYVSGNNGGYYGGNPATYLLVERLGYVDPGDNVTITQNPSTMVLTIE